MPDRPSRTSAVTCRHFVAVARESMFSVFRKELDLSLLVIAMGLIHLNFHSRIYIIVQEPLPEMPSVVVDI